MKKIILIGGDPNSINSEIILKSWRKLSNTLKKKIYLVSNYNLIKDQSKKLKFSIKVCKVKSLKNKNNSDSLKIIDINLKYSRPFNVPIKEASKFVKKSLIIGHNLALNKNVLGLINCPIDKTLLRRNNMGVTEFLASKCNIKNNSEVMLIWNKKFSVSPITTHIDLKDVSKNLKSEIILNKINTINDSFKRIFKKRPKIGILGLNPHNAEMQINSEEKKLIVPSILRMKKKGINLKGPLVSDTLFINDFKTMTLLSECIMIKC